MSKIKKHHLVFENEYEYDLIGICSHISDYRLAWNINECLNLRLEKATDLFSVTNKKGQLTSAHSYYWMSDEEAHLDVYLIKNKCDGKFLIHEKQQIDYFLFICNNVTVEIEDWINRLRSNNSIMGAYAFDPVELSSTEYIVFE